MGSWTSFSVHLVCYWILWYDLDLLPTSRTQGVSFSQVCHPRLDDPLLTFQRRSYGELDILFDKRVPARKFKTTHVDEFEVAEREAAEGVVPGGAMVH